MDEGIESVAVDSVVADAQAEAEAFAAGFAQASGGEVPPESDAPSAAEAEAPAEASEVAPADAVAPVDEPLSQFGGLKVSEVKALLAKAGELDTVKAHLEQRTQKLFGMIGSLQDNIKQLSVKPQTQEVKAETAKQAAKLNKLREEYPELADLLEADLSAATAGYQPAPAVDHATIERAIVEQVNGRLQQQDEIVKRAVGEAVLETKHPEWRNDVNTPDFKVWLGLLNPDTAQRFRSSYDPSYVSTGISEFKKWRAAQQKPQAVPASSDAKKQRLERAIPATHGSQVAQRAMTEHEAMIAAFNAVRAR